MRIRTAAARQVRRHAPLAFLRYLDRSRGREYVPPVGRVRMGDFCAPTPVSQDFGFDRGTPIDRWYIDHFIARHADDIHGRTLEVGDRMYTDRHGGDRIEQADVVDIAADNPMATYVGDLQEGLWLPHESFDCAVITQVLQYMHSYRAALRTLHGCLKPGGTLLLTAPGLSKVEIGDPFGDWQTLFTAPGFSRLMSEEFADCSIRIATYGNVLSASAFLFGLAADELTPEELLFSDSCFAVVHCARIRRAAPVGGARPRWLCADEPES